MSVKISLSEKIRRIAKSSGIDVLGFADASAFSGYAVEQSIRRDPRLSLPDAESIIVAGIYIGGLTLPAWSNDWYGRTSRLYLSGYFSDVIKPLEPIANFLRKAGYKAIISNSSTSEGSIIPLKLAAIRAGIGWQGKHSLLINRKFGTFLALGGIITNAYLEHNSAVEPNHCGKCNKCQNACPLSALEQPFILNRAKCLSNLLQNDEFPPEAQIAIENRIGDCEICQQVCPWNKKHLENPLQTELTISFQEKIRKWEEFFYLPYLSDIGEEKYMEELRELNTAIPFAIFHRNVRIAVDRARKIQA